MSVVSHLIIIISRSKNLQPQQHLSPVRSQLRCHTAMPWPAMMQTISRNVIWLLSQVRVIFHRHTAWSCSTVPVKVVYWSRWHIRWHES